MSEFDSDPDEGYQYRLWDAANELQSEIREAVAKVAATHEVGAMDVLMVYKTDLANEDIEQLGRR